MKARLFIVVPCYNEEQVLEDSQSRLSGLLSNMVERGKVAPESRIVFVDDGSTDRTWTMVVRFHKEDTFSCGLRLAHNAGHQNALVAGMEAALESGADAVITIDADLQDDIAVIPEMVDKWKDGNEVVCGVRKKRDTDTWFKRFSACMYYRLMTRMGVNIVYNHADFRLMDAVVIRRLLDCGERNLFLRGIFPGLTDKVACVYYDRSARNAGQSKYPLGKMIHFAIDGITSFSARPVQALIWVGAIFIVVALVLLCYVLVSYFSGKAVSGWSSMMLSLWFIGGCLMVGLGIVGEYIGRVFIEVKNRPRYYIDTRLLK